MHLRLKLLIVVTNLSVEFQAAQVQYTEAWMLLLEELIRWMSGGQ